MIKKHQLFAILSFLLIPVVALVGFLLSIFIDPEIAAGSANYERNYALLQHVKTAVLLLTLLAAAGLWLLTCSFLLRAKGWSNRWLGLALLGPFGLVILTLLADKAPAPGDLYQQFLHRLHPFLRAAYELVFFGAVWLGALLAMVLKDELTTRQQVAATGLSRAQVVQQQNASSGMAAFGDSLEILLLVSLAYLLRPLCFNLLGRLSRLRKLRR